MNILKSKSLTEGISDEQMGKQCGAMRFISFESAIQLFRQEYNLMELKDKPLGYRVTEQGIEIFYN